MDLFDRKSEGMSLSENTVTKLQKKVDREKAQFIELTEYTSNTYRKRQQLLRLAHYYHLLNNMGAEQTDERALDYYWSLANNRIKKARSYEGKEKEVAESRLVGEHTKAWNFAEYYYEKGNKVLCQMMITLMDYILQEKAGQSVLYGDRDKSSYFDLLDEISGLNEEYVSCYSFLCAYDFCTAKIADFTGIEEYRGLLKEHERIITNGMPRRVTAAIDQLREAAGNDKAEYFTDICRAFVPEPPYDENQLEQIYRQIVEKLYLGKEEMAMSTFSTLVVKVDEAYEQYLNFKE